ncbi:MFS transporter, partial [Erythrobacter donghaensis]
LAGSVALIVAARSDWTTAYIAVSFFGLFAVITGLVMGEPARGQEPKPLKGPVAAAIAYVSPLAEFFKRQGALVVLLFVLVHKIGDTLANLTLRLLFEDLGFTNDELAIYDVGLGFWALLAGIFVGGVLYARLGMKRSVLISLVLMAVSNLAFAGLATVGHSTWAMAGAMGFENFASGIGGVC